MIGDLDINSFTAADFAASDVTLGDVSFKIDKIPATAAWDLLEFIRISIAKSSHGIPNRPGAQLVEVLINAVFALPPGVVSQVRDKIFQRITFQKKSATTWQTLHKAEDTAFDDLEPIAIYELLARGLAVNFSPSLRDLALKLGEDLMNSPPPQPATSQNSSPPP